MSESERDLEERKFLHDISSPLTTVKMTLEMLVDNLKETEIDPKWIERLERTLRNTDRMAQMVNDRRNIIKGVKS